MAFQLGQSVLTLIIGLFMGGLLASFAVAAVPPDWRGPWVPLLAGLAGVALTVLIRRLGPRQEERPTGRNARS